MDVVRCPSKLIVQRIGSIITNLYDHLARRLYAEAQGWQPMHVTQLQEYLDSERKAHYLEGYIGEYIVPNLAITTRESQLYADIQASEDGTLSWNEPQSYTPGLPRFKPEALRVAEALSAYGTLTRKGLDVIAEVWGRLEFKDKETRADAERLTEDLLKQLMSEGLPSAAATSDDLNALYGLDPGSAPCRTSRRSDWTIRHPAGGGVAQQEPAGKRQFSYTPATGIKETRADSSGSVVLGRPKRGALAILVVPPADPPPLGRNCRTASMTSAKFILMALLQGLEA
jgi:hypothetical protein